MSRVTDASGTSADSFVVNAAGAVNAGVATWYDFARKIFELAGNTRVKVTPVATAQFPRPAVRPAYAPLDTRLLRLALDWGMRPWEAALAEYLEAGG